MWNLRTDEFEEVRSYLNKLLIKERVLFDADGLAFYDHNRSVYKPILFRNGYNEHFFVILSYKEYGIYFNDIEESFGICKLDGGVCQAYAEYFDNLAPTIHKLMELLNLEMD